MTGVSRRAFLATGSSGLAVPLFAGRAHAADFDVVVVGAGAAGISATREMRRAGLTVALVEAGSRVGGRVHTDMETFGVPYDIGAHWLHNRQSNPFVDYGAANGFTVYEAPSEGILYVGDRPATDTEYRAYDKAIRKANKAMARAGRKGLDVSPASVMPDLGDWALTANQHLGAYEIAKDFNHFSCLDWYSGGDGTDYYCRQGFGQLFAHSARGVAADLNVSVERIKWGGQGVEVDTDNGTLRARAVVVTVSTGVLASGDIRFDPPLPERKQEAIDLLTMGHYLHIALQISDNFFGVGEDGFFAFKVTDHSDGAPKGFGALVDASGTGITYCDLGGEFARQMSQAGGAVLYDYVVGELKKAFGSRVESAITADSSFDWTSNPLTYGAYASAEPGGAWSREDLRRQVADRLWFAGEALSVDDWSTVAGAHKSGALAAQGVVRVLAR
ncbi:MAG: FAD-dependent oxidoreductase [Rhodobacteraceae bacterium]|nr:FAD-dependent oxidoreductase [Paracoccaceae bacterium]